MFPWWFTGHMFYMKATGVLGLKSDTLSEIRTFTCLCEILVFNRKNSSVIIFNRLMALQLCQLQNGDLAFIAACLQQLQTLCLMRDYRISNLRQGVRTQGMLLLQLVYAAKACPDHQPRGGWTAVSNRYRIFRQDLYFPLALSQKSLFIF